MTTVDSSVQSVFESLSGSNAAKKNEPRGNDELGQADFLELMLAQMKNQDPMNPLEGEQFLAQLAQFATVQGVQSMETSISDLAQSLQSSQALQASSLVGRSVFVTSDRAMLESGASVEGRVAVPTDSVDVTIEIQDAAGGMVQLLKPQVSPEGYAEFQWSGAASGGNTAPPGDYRIAARSVRGGEVLSLETEVLARVDSVSLGQAGQGMQLNLSGMSSRPLSDVLEVL